MSDRTAVVLSILGTVAFLAIAVASMWFLIAHTWNAS